MAKGQKLELDIGAKFDDGWSYDGETFREKNKTNKKSTSNKIEPISSHMLKFRYEKRRGKDVTCVGEFLLSKDDKSKLLKELKKTLGTGGSIKDEWFEFQGKVEDNLRAQLQKRGFKFKN
jgi:translation initiation factor 1